MQLQATHGKQFDNCSYVNEYESAGEIRRFFYVRMRVSMRRMRGIFLNNVKCLRTNA